MAELDSGFLKVQEGDTVVCYPLGPDAQYKLFIDQEPILRVWDRQFTRIVAARFVTMLCIPNKGRTNE